MTTFRKLISTGRAAELLGVSESTIYRLVKRGVLPPPLRLTSTIARHYEADVQALIERALDERDATTIDSSAGDRNGR